MRTLRWIRRSMNPIFAAYYVRNAVCLPVQAGRFTQLASKSCGFSTQSGYYACVQSDPCKGETFEGRCDGNKVIWCENDQVKSLSCNSCGFDSGKGYYNCL